MKEKFKLLLLNLIPSTFSVLLLIAYLEASKKYGVDGTSAAKDYQIIILLLLVVEIVVFFTLKKDEWCNNRMKEI